MQNITPPFLVQSGLVRRGLIARRLVGISASPTGDTAILDAWPRACGQCEFGRQDSMRAPIRGAAWQCGALKWKLNENRRLISDAIAQEHHAHDDCPYGNLKKRLLR
ncbi:hypothetical protein [Burkholderia oklahomensis]|uniref:hypothetical protein n=1 Tax=Burkholderia oklahomensis TaxID=342113 RepID=UPI0012F4B981|nr:hypothetical protein [Burkholderia oklahomensis]MBI0358867.1 hypothetical protein [Burkholderia oklahomensis]QPS36212.1 hypothetical protein I6G57_12730 [Burkholderia oklahomensis]